MTTAKRIERWQMQMQVMANVQANQEQCATCGMRHAHANMALAVA